jgi:quercetin dioxygenase-like cupin family protein
MMTAGEVIANFQRNYPGRNIVVLPEDNPTEIICEVDPSAEHPEYNVAIAAIKASAPHFHRKAIETYEVIEGDLRLTVEGQTTNLKAGDSQTVPTNQVHSAMGDFTVVLVSSRPGWTPEDHILINHK